MILTKEKIMFNKNIHKKYYCLMLLLYKQDIVISKQLFMGAILVGIGNYLDRGAISLYGLIIAIGGFLLYIISSIIVKRKKDNRQDHYRLR
jgi:hypothetical protein